MIAVETFRIVNVRNDGLRVVVMQGLDRETADRALAMLSTLPADWRRVVEPDE